MADGQPAAPLSPQRPFSMRELLRLGAWGLGAVAALIFAVFSISSEAGMDRMALALAGSRANPEPPVQVVTAPDDAEIRRLSDTVRMLAADRDRLLARIVTLERNLDDMTGSIAKRLESRPAEKTSAQIVAALAAPPQALTPQTLVPQALAPQALTLPTLAPSPAAPPPTPVAAPVSRSVTTTTFLPRSLPAPALASIPTAFPEPPPDGDVWANVALPQAPPEAAPDAGQGKSPFGIDLGVAPNVNGLRALWAAAKSRHPAALEHLRPIMVMRESTRPGGMEFRLVVGPLPSAAAAARLCASLAAFSSTCRPALFEGQRLAAR